MADFWETAAKTNSDTRSALISAIATQGSNARSSLDQAQKAIQQQKAAALSAALSAAQQRGAPQGMQDETAATIGTGYDRRLADLASSGASRQASFDNMAASAGTYFDEANAAIPVLRARQQQQDSINSTSLANRLAEMKAQQDSQSAAGQRELQQLGMNLEDRKQQRDYEAAQSKKQQDYETALHELQLNIAQANALKATVGADAAASKAATPKAAKPAPGANKIITDNFGNQQGFADYVNQATPALNDQAAQQQSADVIQLRKLGAGGNLAARAEANLTPLRTALTPADVAEQVGSQVGLAPGVGGALLQPSAVKAVNADKKSADTAAKRVLTADEASKATGLHGAELAALTAKVAKSPDKKVKGTLQRPYDDAIATMEDARRKGGSTLAVLNADLQTGFAEKYGHDFPNIRALVSAMYSNVLPGR